MKNKSHKKRPIGTIPTKDRIAQIASRYLKIVSWSTKDKRFVGACPELFNGGCHGKDETKVYAQLCEIVREHVSAIFANNESLPVPAMAAKIPMASNASKNQLPLPSPGDMLREDFLEPLAMTPAQLAKQLNMPSTCIEAILAGTQPITLDTGLRLDHYFGLTVGWWNRLQADCDVRQAQRKLGQRIANEVKPRSPADHSNRR